MGHINYSLSLQGEVKSVQPNKLICIGRNYVEHIRELGSEVPDEMVVFLKPSSAISDELLSFHQEPLHYEAELCYMVKGGKFVGVGLGLDLTKRDLQRKLKAKGLPWERSKAFDGAAVFSNFILDEQLANHPLCFTLHIDDELTQIGHTELMMYRPSQILENLQSFMKPEDGDVIMSGTPKGVGQVSSGATFALSLYHDIPFASDEEMANSLTRKKPIIKQSWLAK